jgi:hypothetical protein
MRSECSLKAKKSPYLFSSMVICKLAYLSVPSACLLFVEVSSCVYVLLIVPVMSKIRKYRSTTEP